MNIANARPVGVKCGVVYKGRPPCKQPAGYRTEHVGEGACAFHGGLMPVVKAAAAERLVDYRANRALQAMAMPIRDADPEQTLLDLVAEAAGNVAFLGHQVMELAGVDVTEADRVNGPLWKRLTGYSKGSALFGPQIDVDKDGGEHIVGEVERGMVKLYGQWADRLAKYAKMALDAGIEKRRVEMAERHGEQVVIVINNVLVRMGISGDRLAEARTMVAAEFRQLASGDEG
jgi:hypothetical protein